MILTIERSSSRANNFSNLFASISGALASIVSRYFISCPNLSLRITTDESLAGSETLVVGFVLANSNCLSIFESANSSFSSCLAELLPCINAAFSSLSSSFLSNLMIPLPLKLATLSWKIFIFSPPACPPTNAGLILVSKPSLASSIICQPSEPLLLLLSLAGLVGLTSGCLLFLSWCSSDLLLLSWSLDRLFIKIGLFLDDSSKFCSPFGREVFAAEKSLVGLATEFAIAFIT